MAGFLVCEDRDGPRKRLVAGLRAGTVAALAGGPVPVCVVDRVTELVSVWEATEPEVVVLGTGSDPAASLAGMRALLARAPQAVVLVAGSGMNRRLGADALAAGASGFLRLEGLDLAAAGAGPAPHPRAAARPRPGNPPPGGAARRGVRRDDSVLSGRERDVLAGMSHGLSDGQIARRLVIEPETVKTYAHRMFSKLQVRGRADAVAAGFRHGLLH